MKDKQENFFIIAHNIRSAYNIGSILRTADAVGADMVYMTGYSASPFKGKSGSPFLSKAEKMVAKTALGAEKNVKWKKERKLGDVIRRLKQNGFEIAALEQDKKSISYKKYAPNGKVAVILGNEPKGIDKRTLRKCDKIIEIPMRGKKKSLNVSVAFGIAAYELYDKIK